MFHSDPQSSVYFFLILLIATHVCVHVCMWRTVSNSRWFILMIFQRCDGARSVGAILKTLNFDMRYSPLSRGWVAAPHQPCDHKVHSRYTDSHSVFLFFTFSGVFNKLHEIFNTSLQNRLCGG